MTQESLICIVCVMLSGFYLFLLAWSDRQVSKILEIVVMLKDRLLIVEKKLIEHEERINKLEEKNSNFPNNISDIYTEKIENKDGVVVGYATKSFLEEIKDNVFVGGGQ